jgi:hypothetical protein
LSFEVYVQGFKRGEPAGVPRSAVRALFPVVEAESEPGYWSIRYDHLNSCHVAVSALPADPALVQSLCVVRPCGDPRLWDALLALLRLGPLTLYSPGEGPPLVASEATGEQLPADMVEALGAPRVVRSGSEILAAIESA